MKVLLLLLQSYLKRFLRHFYWLYRLNSVKFGKHPHLEFPIRVEGKGSICFGDNCVLQRLTHLGIGLTSKLRVGHNSLLENKSTIIVSNNSKINILDNFKLGSNSRIYVKGKWSFGNDVQIETNSAIFAREPSGSGKLIIGHGTHIGDNTIIDMVNDVLIGNEVAIGPNCTLYTHDHEYSDKNVPAWKGGIVSKAIYIGDGAWIGSNVTILPGIVIGKRAVIAAGSVVTKNVESETIYGGIPAKKIKDI